MAATSDTSHEHVENNVNVIGGDGYSSKKNGEEVKRTLISSSESDQGEKTVQKVDDANPIKQADNLSSVQSINENMNPNITSTALSNSSDIGTEKKNEGNTDVTAKRIEQPEELGSTSTSSITTDKSSSNVNDNEDSAKYQSISNNLNSKAGDDNKDVNPKSSADISGTNKDDTKNDTKGFSIEKGDSKYLTDFQRQKAKYFFNVNLDIENKEYLIWDDVEFYLLFHVTAAGKEGSDGGNLEASLSRAARALWEYIHDQIPLPDNTRDKLTLDQFLDTWASLIDYVVRTNQLPSIVQDLVKLGFTLYSTDSNDEEPATIQPYAFDQLFQKMNLGRTHAIMAFKILTENGNVPLNADKIESLVKAVLTSSDDDHNSHFLLPGFYKLIAANKSREEDKTNPSSSSSPIPNRDQSETGDQSSSIPTPPPTSQPQPTSTSISSSSSATLPQNQESSSTPSKESKQNTPVIDQTNQNSTSQNGAAKSFPSGIPNNDQQNTQVPLDASTKTVIQTEDENIRRLLRFYHIDDGDFVEVAGGSVQRVVLLHPERPLPPYIQQNPKLLEKLNIEKTTSGQQYRANAGPNQSNTNAKPLQQRNNTDMKPKVTLEERLSRGEAQMGPTVPLRHEQKQGTPTSTRIRQVYPPLSEAQQAEQQKQAKIQTSQSVNNLKNIAKESSIADGQKLTEKEKQDLIHDEKAKLVASVLKQLTPIVQKQIADELDRIQSGDDDQDDDDGFVPFPFMFAAGGNPFFVSPHQGPPPSRTPGQQQQQDSEQDASDPKQQQQNANAPKEPKFRGLPPGAAFIPPPLLMAMMNDLAMSAMGGDIPIFAPNMPPNFPSNMPPNFPPNMPPNFPPNVRPNFPFNMPPPPGGPGGMPGGMGGFMMFVDDHPMRNGPPRAGPRF